MYLAVVKLNTFRQRLMKDKKVLRSVRIEQDVDTWLKMKAEKGDRSFNAEVNRQLKKAKDEEKPKENQ